MSSTRWQKTAALPPNYYGVGRGRGVPRGRGVTLGVEVAVAVGVGVTVGVTEAVGVGVIDGVGEGVGDGVGHGTGAHQRESIVSTRQPSLEPVVSLAIRQRSLPLPVNGRFTTVVMKPSELPLQA